MRKLFAMAGLCLLFAACTATPPQNTEPVTKPKTSEAAKPAPKADSNLLELLPEGHNLGSAVEVGGIRIVPILNPDAPTETDYLTLHEAMEAGLCTVTEQEQVNELLLTNKADKPLFLMVGDLVLGGDQDRIMGESIVIDASAENVPVPVFCVEPHRWEAEAGNEASANGQFYTRKGARQVDMNVKNAAMKSANQQRVWDAVGGVNSALSVETNEGGSFRSAFDDKETAKKLDEMYAKASQASGKGAVGYAVVRDGEVVAMDLFDSSGLCAKLSEQLIRSYLVTAMSGDVETRSESAAGPTMQLNNDSFYAQSARGDHARLAPSEEDIALRKRLEGESTSLKFANATLEDVLARLRTEFEVDASNVDASAEVSVDLSEVTFKQALDTLCTELELVWLIRDAQVLLAPNPAITPVGVETRAINRSTQTTRHTKKKSVEYTCTDTERKSPVHRSYMKR